MINLFNTQIDQLYIHKVGNKCRKEELFLSQDPYQINDEIRPVLKEFFLKSFREKELQFFQFSEAAIIPDLLVPYNMSLSSDIAEHLYKQGVHPHIKAGEVYICELSNIQVDNEVFSGYGIFKSEIKYDFIEFNKTESRLDLILKQGVNLDKLDKGAIIIQDPNFKTGFKVLYIDSNKYDSKYWMGDFLELEELNDARTQTKNYLKFCRDFAKDVVKPAEGKQSEISFVNDSFQHFASRDEFIEEAYCHEVVPQELHDEFQQYKIERSPVYSFNEFDSANFEIVNEAVTDALKKVKGDIELDTGLTIKIEKGTGAAKHLEKGWDEEKQMYYYLAYFNKENN